MQHAQQGEAAEIQKIMHDALIDHEAKGQLINLIVKLELLDPIAAQATSQSQKGWGKRTQPPPPPPPPQDQCMICQYDVQDQDCWTCPTCHKQLHIKCMNGYRTHLLKRCICSGGGCKCHNSLPYHCPCCRTIIPMPGKLEKCRTPGCILRINHLGGHTHERMY